MVFCKPDSSPQVVFYIPCSHSSTKTIRAKTYLIESFCQLVGLTMSLVNMFSKSSSRSEDLRTKLAVIISTTQMAFFNVVSGCLATRVLLKADCTMYFARLVIPFHQFTNAFLEIGGSDVL